MKTFTVADKEYTVPDIEALVNEEGSPTIFKINEGEHAGVTFALDDLRIDDNDDTLLWYDLKTEKEKNVDDIKEIVDNFILMVLHEQTERVLNETGETSD